jgi:hydroxymethylpyrimidine pyrophosphatase-like HAD family hydrolase
MRCLYVDLDGTLLGPGGSLLRGAGGRFSLDAARALQACDRAGVEVVLYSGRRERSVFEDSRVLGISSYSFELGCALVIDGELEWLTDGIVPSEKHGTIYDQIERSGAAQLLLERYAGRLEYHTPWSAGRDVSHLFRGDIELSSAQALLDKAGFDWLRLVDNGIVHENLGSMGDLTVVRVYHLIPAGASKTRSVARHMQARGYSPTECIAVGDSREDMEVAAVVGSFWFVSNALESDPSLSSETGRFRNVRIASSPYGAGVYEAVVTTLAER